MKTREITLDEQEFVIGRMNARDATFFTINRLSPILGSLSGSLSQSSDMGVIANALGQLSREDYDELENKLFGLIQVRQNNNLFSIIKDGKWMYDNVRDDGYLYLSLLKESFTLSFGDFFLSAARVFPNVAAFLKDVLDMKVSKDT